jgi:hypothetical protein
MSNTLSPASPDLPTFFFPDLAAKTLTANFSGGQISSDGGGLLIARLDRSYGFLSRFAACFQDQRDPELIEHDLLHLLRQRIYGLALGYEDLNDHDQLRCDPLLASLCGKDDPLGQDRLRDQDKGKALAGKSTLNRLELTPAQATPAQARYKRIVAQPQDIETYFLSEWVHSLAKDTPEVVLDLDRTDDPLYGNQEGRFFHGYYDEYCYTPLYIFCGHWPVAAALHTSDTEHLDEVIRLLGRILETLHQRLPNVRIVVRGDSGFCRDELMCWCEEHGVRYIFGLAPNAVLNRILRGSLRAAQSMQAFNDSESERVFKDFRYRAKKWGCNKRRVVGKAEWTRQGGNPRYVITNIPIQEVAARALYEEDYCGRGDMENRIKEQKLDLFAGRTSTESLRANQLRLWFSLLAYLLVNKLREVGLSGTQLANASCGTIRTRLLKIGAQLRVTVRRVWVEMSSAFPLKEVFVQALSRLPVAASG